MCLLNRRLYQSIGDPGWYNIYLALLHPENLLSTTLALVLIWICFGNRFAEHWHMKVQYSK